MQHTHSRKTRRPSIPFNPDQIPQFGPAYLDLWAIDPLPMPTIRVPRQQQKGGR